MNHKFLFHEPLMGKNLLNLRESSENLSGENLGKNGENLNLHERSGGKGENGEISQGSENLNSNDSHENLNSNAEQNAHGEHSHAHFDPRKSDKKVLLIAFAMTCAMMVVQFIYAIASNSLALLSDTLHMFSDAFALILSFLAILATQKLRSEQKTFGYFRLEVLVALINGLTVMLSAAFISYEAVEKLINPSSVDAATMLIVATIGLGVNAMSGFLMFKGGNLENINIRSAFLHLLSDLLSSIAVIVGGVVVYFTQIYYIDTILGLFIALLLVRWAFLLIKQSVNILLESSPIDIKRVRAEISGFEGVAKIEDLHISQITNKMFVATMHLQVRSDSVAEFEALSRQISSVLYEKFDIGHCTIEPSFGG